MTELFPTLNIRKCDDLNKEQIYKENYTALMNRCLNMFTWSNLPNEIDPKYLELYLLSNATVAFFHLNNRYYITFGNYGGEPNEYYLPRYYVVANPYIPLVENMLECGSNVVVGHNNSLMTPLTPTIEKYATLLTENTITMKMACVNSRMQTVISASDNQTIESANLYIKNLNEGKYSVIAENEFLQGVRVQPTTSNNRLLIDVIELQQYNKASFYQEIGLNANHNMKRESLNSSETDVNEPSLKPLVYDMLENRRNFCERVNALYGLNISVDFSSAWNSIDEPEEETEETEETIGTTDIVQSLNHVVTEESTTKEEDGKEESENEKS